MPVEFAVAAYRFGHSMIRDTYWVNFNFPNATLGQVFEFNRNPAAAGLLELGRRLQRVLRHRRSGAGPQQGPEDRQLHGRTVWSRCPGFAGLMAILATRNLRRGLALGLPSGQGMASFFGIAPMTRGAADVRAARGRSGRAELQRRPAAEQDAALVLRASRGGGPRRRQSARAGRRQDRGGDVRPDPEARRLFVPELSGGFTPILPSAAPGTSPSPTW